jgi:hypothetical protein
LIGSADKSIEIWSMGWLSHEHARGQGRFVQRGHSRWRWQGTVVSDSCNKGIRAAHAAHEESAKGANHVGMWDVDAAAGGGMRRRVNSEAGYYRPLAVSSASCGERINARQRIDGWLARVAARPPARAAAPRWQRRWGGVGWDGGAGAHHLHMAEVFGGAAEGEEGCGPLVVWQSCHRCHGLKRWRVSGVAQGRGGVLNALARPGEAKPLRPGRAQDPVLDPVPGAARRLNEVFSRRGASGNGDPKAPATPQYHSRALFGGRVTAPRLSRARARPSIGQRV